ncbi:MAG: hypothetical protein MHPDNHAH_00907 [Anaerolineales bacterium]|nr:hypothetical protein [Anaerolineales bacterium]WKZ46295.1 MAG: DUF998 domain-containing protein [Anaerolineales bacterium]
MTKSLGAKPVSGFEVNAARVSIISGGLFLLLLVSLHALEPEFDPTWRFISEYALGKFGWMMSLAFASLAISLASAGAAVFSRVRNVVGYIGLAILVLAVVGLFIAGSFKTDPIFTKPADLSTSGQMHILGASLDYSPLAFLLLSFSLARHAEWSSAKKWLFLTAIVSIALTIGFIFTIPADGVFGPGVYSGLVGRLLLISYLGWLATVDFHVLMLNKQ